MNYLDLGYSEFLSRDNPQTQQLNPLASDLFTQDLSGSKVQGGVMNSNDNRVSLDLEGNVFTVSDGVTQRVILGTQPDGSYGLTVKNKDGNTLQQITGDTNIMKSPSGNMQIDFDNQRIVFYDDSGLPQAVFGNI